MMPRSAEQRAADMFSAQVPLRRGQVAVVRRICHEHGLVACPKGTPSRDVLASGAKANCSGENNHDNS